MTLIRLLPAIVVLVIARAQTSAPQPPLRDLAERRGIRIGTAINPALFQRDATYAEVAAREFNQVEAENSTKFGPIHPARDTYRFEPVDALLEFAEAHGQAMRGHTLVWHKQNANWVTNGAFTPEQLADILHEHIQKVVGRYAGRIYAWDVVNEAFEGDGTLRKSPWGSERGYIEQAFRWAHAADPKALLFYNDYDAEGINAKSDAIYGMAKDFKAEGVPIHGIGLQMHLTLTPPSMESIEANIRRLTDLGLQVQYTELDVRLPVEAGKASAADLEKQATIFRDVVALCLKYKGCTAIQTWGFTDKYSWIPGAHRGFGAALEFDAEFAPKPAYRAIVEALKAGLLPGSHAR